MHLTPDFSDVRLANSKHPVVYLEAGPVNLRYTHENPNSDAFLHFGFAYNEKFRPSSVNLNRIPRSYFVKWQALFKSLVPRIKSDKFKILKISTPTTSVRDVPVESKIHQKILLFCSDEIPDLFRSKITYQTSAFTQFQVDFSSLDQDYRPSETLPEDFYA
jgi:hypothetical protein